MYHHTLFILSYCEHSSGQELRHTCKIIGQSGYDEKSSNYLFASFFPCGKFVKFCNQIVERKSVPFHYLNICIRIECTMGSMKYTYVTGPRFSFSVRVEERKSHFPCARPFTCSMQNSALAFPPWLLFLGESGVGGPFGRAGRTTKEGMNRGKWKADMLAGAQWATYLHLGVH